ncbi:Uncharacterised protein [Bordetella trematum]|nr:Uncharacterised protein [Bordetella trematum]
MVALPPEAPVRQGQTLQVHVPLADWHAFDAQGRRLAPLAQGLSLAA